MAKTKVTITVKEVFLNSFVTSRTTDTYEISKMVNTTDYHIGDIMKKSDVDGLIRKGVQVIISK